MKENYAIFNWKEFINASQKSTVLEEFFLGILYDGMTKIGRGRYLAPRDIPLEFAPTSYHPNTAKGQILHNGTAFVEYQLSCILSFPDG